MASVTARPADRTHVLVREGVRLQALEWEPVGPPEPGPGLLLLHGLSSNARIWERTAAHLPGRRLVALDQRGHGGSERPVRGYDWETLIADAAHAIGGLGLGRPVVAGHSWGASVALHLAASRPDLVAALASVDGPLGGPMSELMTWEQAAERMQPPLPVYPDLAAAAADTRRGIGERHWGDDLTGFVAAGLVAVEGGLASTLTAEVRLQILRQLYAAEPDRRWPRVAGPILVALADQPFPGAAESAFGTWRRRGAERVAELRPDAVVRWYHSAHDIPLIQPAQLAADLDHLAAAAGHLDRIRDRASPP